MSFPSGHVTLDVQQDDSGPAGLNVLKLQGSSAERARNVETRVYNDMMIEKQLAQVEQPKMSLSPNDYQKSGAKATLLKSSRFAENSLNSVVVPEIKFRRGKKSTASARAVDNTSVDVDAAEDTRPGKSSVRGVKSTMIKPKALNETDPVIRLPTDRHHQRREREPKDEDQQLKEHELQEEVNMMRIRTLYRMVDELEVVSDGRNVRQRVVWLTNKQANSFTPSVMKRLLSAMNINIPPNLIIFIRGGMFSGSMATNGGAGFLTRVKFCRFEDITLLDGKKIDESSATTVLKPGQRVFVHEEGTSIKGQILEHTNGTATVLFDDEVLPVEFTEKAIAHNDDGIETLERRISLFVTQALMPMVKRTGALVVCGGTNMCSICSAIGKEFEKLSSASYMENGNAFRKDGDTDSMSDRGNSLGSTASEQTQNASTDSSGAHYPRLLAIVRSPHIAFQMSRPGSNAHSLVQAATKKNKGSRSNLNFLTPNYQKEFLRNANGDDKKAWMQYDLIDGATDIIMIDCKNAQSGWKDYSAYAYFENTFVNTFTHIVPSLAIQYGQPPNDENLNGIAHIISKGSDVLVLDSRKRKLFLNHTTTKDSMPDTRVSLHEALAEYEEWHRVLWREGSTEQHIAATIAYFHRVFCKRLDASRELHTMGVSDKKKMFICEAIKEIERRESSMAHENNLDENVEDDESNEVDYLGRGHNEDENQGSHSLLDKARTNSIKVKSLGQEKDSKIPLSLNAVVTRIITVYRANMYVREVIKDLYLVNRRANGHKNHFDVGKSKEIQDIVKTPMSVLAARHKISCSELWLRIYTLLKPSWQKGNYMGSDLYSGSLYHLNELERTLEMRVALVDRLPEKNSLSELMALREAWSDIDRYEAFALSAKRMSKISFIVLLLFGIASVIVSTMTGMGYFGKISSSDSDESSPFNNLGNVAAFSLALFSSFFASYIAYSSPMQRWQQLKSAALQLRSEIFQFRTRTGLYDYTVKTPDSRIMRQNVMAMRDMVLARASIDSSTFFKQNSPSTFKHGQYSIPQRNIRWQEGSRRSCNWCYLKHAPEGAVFPSSSPDVKDQTEESLIDDYHKPLGPSLYIKIRLDSTMRFYQSRINPYYFGKTFCAVLMMLVTAASALMASLNLTAWIGIVSVIGSSVTSWSEFSGTSKKLSRYATAITRLRGIRLWWHTLSTVEKSNSINVNMLVKLTEEVIMQDAKAWMATSDAAQTFSKTLASAQGK